MPELAVVMIGMDGWKEWTKPALDSVRQFLPDANVVIVDHGREQYPQVKGVTNIRFTNPVSYSKAINEGVKAAYNSDWFLIVNNDIMVYEPLHFSNLDPDFIHAARILHENNTTWAEGWLILVSRKVWDIVGDFDENFTMTGFEDADWCIRAAQLGIAIQPLKWNVKHFWGKTRWKIPGYKEQRIKNIAYLNQKHGKNLGVNVKVLYG